MTVSHFARSVHCVTRLVTVWTKWLGDGLWLNRKLLCKLVLWLLLNRPYAHGGLINTVMS